MEGGGNCAHHVVETILVWKKKKQQQQNRQEKGHFKSIFLSLCHYNSNFPLKNKKTKPNSRVKWFSISGLWVWSDFEKCQTNGVLLWSEVPQGTGFPIMVFSKFTFGGFPQLPGSVSYYLQRPALSEQKGSESESSDTLTVGMFISYLPHVTAQSTGMCRTAVLTRKDGDLSSCYAALTDCFLEFSFCI